MSEPCLSGHSGTVSSVYLNAEFSRLSRASHGVGTSKEVVSLWPTPVVSLFAEMMMCGCKSGQMTLLPAQRAKVRGNGIEANLDQATLSSGKLASLVRETCQR